MAPRAIACLLAAAAITGCSADARPPGQSGGVVLPPGPTTNTGACVEPPATATEICITSVKGEVVDANGRGITLPINLCNAGVCFSTRSDDGIFSVEVNKFLDLSTFMIHAYGYPDYSDTFVPLQRPAGPTVALAAPVYVAFLEHRGPIVPTAAASPTTLVAGPIEITLPQGMATTFYPAHDLRELRAGAIPDPKRFDPSLVALFALGPFGAQFSVKAETAVTLPPASGLADGTRLEVVSLEDDLASPNVAKLVVVGGAMVTGGVARTAPGSGIPRLTWIGMRTPTPSP